MSDPTTDDVLEPEFDEGLPHSRTQHGGMPPQSDDDLEAAVERDRVAAGLEDYAPVDVPPATDPPPEEAAEVVDRAQRGLLGDTSAAQPDSTDPSSRDRS